MKNFLSKLKDTFSASESETLEADGGFLELEASEIQDKKAKIIIKPFMLESFEDVKPVLDALRAGYTIVLLNIAPLKDKDIVELKRAVNKLKKTAEAMNGDIAGFGEDWLVIAPAFAEIHRGKQPTAAQADLEDSDE